MDKINLKIRKINVPEAFLHNTIKSNNKNNYKIFFKTLIMLIIMNNKFNKKKAKKIK